jgi:hypothetical protein
MPDGVETDIVKALYRVETRGASESLARVRLLGSGAILPQVLEAARRVETDWGVAAEVLSATSFSELARDAREFERRNRLNPGLAQETSHVARHLSGRSPIIAATDYVRAYPQMIAAYVDAPSPRSARRDLGVAIRARRSAVFSRSTPVISRLRRSPPSPWREASARRPSPRLSRAMGLRRSAKRHGRGDIGL